MVPAGAFYGKYELPDQLKRLNLEMDRAFCFNNSGRLSKIHKERAMEREPVNSASVASVGYDESSETLEIEFGNSAVYRYFGVPEQVYLELLTSSSLGRFGNYKIKPYFPYQQN
jgi:hypothetical protein